MAYLIPDNYVVALKELPKIIEWVKNFKMTAGRGIKIEALSVGRGATFAIALDKLAAGVDGKRAILDLRYNTTTHWIQAAYVANPAEEDWEDKIQFTICPGISVAEFGAF